MDYTLTLDKKIYEAFVETIGEHELKERANELFLASLESMLVKYSREILRFEEKYGVSFPEYERLWDEGKIEAKYSYEVEADFIDWEMLEMEKKELLKVLAKLKEKRESVFAERRELH